MSERHCGTVLNWHERGFGFIQADNLETNVFCHRSQLKFHGPKMLRAGQRVTFQTVTGARGLEAQDVHFF